jgi:hypothetical protein
MEIAHHMRLAAEWQDSLKKLDPETDCLAICEIAMMLGTALLNAALHGAGITAPDGDQRHSRKPRHAAASLGGYPKDVRAMFDDLFEIECMRQWFCRGIVEEGSTVDPGISAAAAAGQCMARIAAMRKRAATVVAARQGEVA